MDEGEVFVCGHDGGVEEDEPDVDSQGRLIPIANFRVSQLHSFPIYIRGEVNAPFHLLQP